MVPNKFKSYGEDDFSEFNFYPIDNENFSDEYGGFHNINAIDSNTFDTLNNSFDFKSSPTSSMMDSDFIPFNTVFASSVIPFGSGTTYENKSLPNTQNIPQDPTLLKDIENNVLNHTYEDIARENSSTPLDITSSKPSYEKEAEDVTKIVDIYEIERILNNVEDKNPLIIQTLLAQTNSYPSMRILLRRIIKLSLKYHYEK
ncbi:MULTISPECIES: hypothetical protein [Clostridium]|uniref:Uncharacterized protein n=1 Tax=Clostridium cadaveris TaxID=1529 RepID=A0A1I2NUN1_9CLOT|nr:hypothetical protein [Clostridium cadaveris]MDU4952871.1 hypothetical protein [Clostridium sp.]MDM8312570.1 hypothetical protein [Clostridium cadaveris]MDY4949407.1 hypothetical protein [Clostridium cadaveris]NME65717.1 hypothetical protein [Clostridium cadaveris]NWK12257.1 hypothetical protein [Clostridium cadaveris]